MKVISINPQTAKLLAEIGNYLFFVIIGIFAFWVIGKFVGNLNQLREEA